MNVQVSGNSSDFVGKLLSHLLERTRAMGMQYAHGPAGELMWYYTRMVKSDEMEETWGVVAVMLKGLIETKRKQIAELKEDLEQKRFATIETARGMLVEALTLESEMDELQSHLEAMANE